MARDVPRWETDQRETLRATFDEDPDAYERSRPVAPAQVFDDLVRLADLNPGSKVVEIGPGTGQATRQLAERGMHVIAVELGRRLAQRVRENLADYEHVDVVNSSFEAWEPHATQFDAVFACNSFHWVDPAVRFRKSAALLQPGSPLVVLATPWVIPDHADRFWWDVQDDYVAVGGTREDPAEKHPDRIGDLAPAVRASGLFDEPSITRHLFEVTFTAEGYATNLSTQSGFKEFAPDARRQLVARVTQRITDAGGALTAHLLAILTVARRVP